MRRLPLAAQASATNPRGPVRCFAIRPVRRGFCPPETTRLFSPCGSPRHAGISAVSTLQRRVRAGCKQYLNVPNAIQRTLPTRPRVPSRMPRREIAEDREGDIVVGETPGVLGHSEFLEPMCNLLHRGPPLRAYRQLPEPKAYQYSPQPCRSPSLKATFLS